MELTCVVSSSSLQTARLQPNQTREQAVRNYIPLSSCISVHSFIDRLMVYPFWCAREMSSESLLSQSSEAQCFDDSIEFDAQRPAEDGADLSQDGVTLKTLVAFCAAMMSASDEKEIRCQHQTQTTPHVTLSDIEALKSITIENFISDHVIPFNKRSEQSVSSWEAQPTADATYSSTHFVCYSPKMSLGEFLLLLLHYQLDNCHPYLEATGSTNQELQRILKQTNDDFCPRFWIDFCAINQAEHSVLHACVDYKEMYFAALKGTAVAINNTLVLLDSLLAPKSLADPTVMYVLGCSLQSFQIEEENRANVSFAYKTCDAQDCAEKQNELRVFSEAAELLSADCHQNIATLFLPAIEEEQSAWHQYFLSRLHPGGKRFVVQRLKKLYLCFIGELGVQLYETYLSSNEEVSAGFAASVGSSMTPALQVMKCLYLLTRVLESLHFDAASYFLLKEALTYSLLQDPQVDHDERTEERLERRRLRAIVSYAAGRVAGKRLGKVEDAMHFLLQADEEAQAWFARTDEHHEHWLTMERSQSRILCTLARLNQIEARFVEAKMIYTQLLQKLAEVERRDCSEEKIFSVERLTVQNLYALSLYEEATSMTLPEDEKNQLLVQASSLLKQTVTEAKLRLGFSKDFFVFCNNYAVVLAAAHCDNAKNRISAQITKYYRRIVTLAEHELGSYDPTFLSMLNSFGKHLLSCGVYHRAEKMLQKELLLLRVRYPREDQKLVDCVQSLGEVFAKQGKVVEQRLLQTKYFTVTVLSQQKNKTTAQVLSLR